MNILDARAEEKILADKINWQEREELAYPEDAPIMKKLREHVPAPKRKFSKSEQEGFRKHYEKCGHKPTTCKKFEITKAELEEALKNV